ncbi:MAG: alpha/beta hydrolase [Candidatus ainarchaeum sp.]|nr:alpha/beta hydrolase [Candidatus ainarchaeum sp.]
MVNVFVFHGAGGHPEENWFGWLKRELEKTGSKVYVPEFPTPENQTLEEWLKVFKKYDKLIGKDSIFIGHSLGVPFLLTLIEKYKIKSAFLVSGFTGKVENKYNDSMKTFTYKKFEWEKIIKNCGNFYIFHSDNDPYIPLSKSEELADNLKSKIILIKNAGHFNSSSGYDKFEELMEKISKEIKK